MLPKYNYRFQKRSPYIPLKKGDFKRFLLPPFLRRGDLFWDKGFSLKLTLMKALRPYI